jgi:NADPH-dependent glutamate synthase beta chain and related oxidoreductases
VPAPGTEITAKDKRVIVVGGGDTGMDCISNSNREGARSVHMLDVYADLAADGADPTAPLAAAAQADAHDICARRGRKAPLGH